MSAAVRRQYKPDELRAAIAALMNNQFHPFPESEAQAIVIALHKLGFRIIKVDQK